MKANNLLFDPAAGGHVGGGAAPAGTPPPPAGGAADWRATLPEDIRGNTSLATIPDVPTLAKSYVHAQSMIGMKRLAVPSKDAAPEAWNEVWNTLGRPEAPDKYSPATVKPAAGVTLDQEGVKKALTVFHQAGLTDSQATKVLDFYTTGLNETHAQMSQRLEQGKSSAEEALRRDWGDKYNANLEVAQGVLRRFGTPEAMTEIEAGLGNNPALIKMLHNMGSAMMEDRSKSGPGLVSQTGEAAAQQKIGELKMDENFMKKLNGRNEIGHKEAVEQWLNLHRQASPKQVE